MPVSNLGVERIYYQVQPTPSAPAQPSAHEGGVRYFMLPVQTPAYSYPPAPMPMPSLSK